MNRHPASAPCLSMILSESRRRLFRIMPGRPASWVFDGDQRGCTDDLRSTDAGEWRTSLGGVRPMSNSAHGAPTSSARRPSCPVARYVACLVRLRSARDGGQAEKIPRRSDRPRMRKLPHRHEVVPLGNGRSRRRYRSAFFSLLLVRLKRDPRSQGTTRCRPERSSACHGAQRRDVSAQPRSECAAVTASASGATPAQPSPERSAWSMVRSGRLTTSCLDTRP